MKDAKLREIAENIVKGKSPGFHKDDKGTLWFEKRLFDPASEQLGSEPRNRSTTTPLVIDRRCTVNLAKKAKSLPANREHTQEHKGMQPNCR
jgi:hypothetical protein